MPPETAKNQRDQIENRLRTIYQCALALLNYENKYKQQLAEVNVSHSSTSTSSGDNKTLSPEEIEITLAKYSRINPDDLPKL